MKTRTQPPCSRSRGFTLVELLTVIAIIAVLTAILLPVMGTAREQARKGQCMTNMRSIVQGLQMYKDDWRVYPDALFGYTRVLPNGACPATTTNATGELEQSRLYIDYVKDPKVFNCPNSFVKMNSTALVDVVNRASGVLHVDNPARPGFKYCYRAWDSYDFQYMPNGGGATAAINRELRFNRKHSLTSAGISDSQRQLIYRNPPDSTVVTWCLYHSDMNSTGVVPPNGMTIVAFLSGRVQTIPYSQLPRWSATSGPWLVNPKP